MKFFIVLALAAAVAADVSHLVRNDEASAQVLRQESDVQPTGYNYVYETSNGIAGQESGQIKNYGQQGESLEVQGQNQYTAPDGQVIQISYLANENGYQPSGAHLPTAPPAPAIPDYIARSLEWIAAHPPQEKTLARF